MTYFESVAGQNAVEHIANAIGEIAARMQQRRHSVLKGVSSDFASCSSTYSKLE